MKKIIVVLGLLAALAAVVMLTGQVSTVAPGTGIEASTAARTAPVRIGAADPGTCDNAVREMFFNTATDTLKVCTALDTWTAISGAGGASIGTGTYAAIPAGAEEDLYFPTDSAYLLRKGAAAWARWGPLFPMTEPVSGDFAWVNQGGASIDTSKGGVYLLAPASATDSIRIRKKAAPATPYTITAYIFVDIFPANYGVAGLCWRESGSSKLVVFSVAANSTSYSSGYGLELVKWTNETTISAVYAGYQRPDKGIWLRLEDDGANRKTYFSTNGQFWTLFHTVGRTDFLTADEVGFFANSVNASYPVGIWLLSWKEN